MRRMNEDPTLLVTRTGTAPQGQPEPPMCRVCDEPILGRPVYSKTCLVHREYPAPPTRGELVALIEEREALVVSLRKGLAAMDAAGQEHEQSDGEVPA